MIIKYIRYFYFLILFAFYAYIEINYLKSRNNEAGVAMVMVMAILTAPLGIAFPYLLSIMGGFFPLDSFSKFFPYGDDLFGFLVWLGMAAIGYWQWFVLLPKVIARFRNWRGTRLS